MKAAIKVLALAILLTSGSQVFSQKKEKIYFDAKWNPTTDTNAPYYRLISYDKNGDIIGTVKDYYATGELQMELEPLVYDKLDDDRSTWKKKIEYYKSGRKQTCTINDSEGEEDYVIEWKDNKNASITYFEVLPLDALESYPLELSHDYFAGLVARKERFSYTEEVEKQRNESGGNSFNMVHRGTKEITGSIAYTKEKELVSIQLKTDETAACETELAKQGFTNISKTTIKDKSTGAPTIESKWGKENYPYRYIVRYNQKDRSNGLLVLLSNIASSY
jgi:hypothetical protein